MKYHLSTFLFSALLFPYVSATAQFDKGFSKPFELSIQETMDRSKMPGLAIAIVHDGAEVYTKAFGVRDFETQVPLSTTDLFHWASVTKPFVATAAMQLVEQGKLDLDKPVTTYLPYFRMNDPDYPQITVRHLLTHTGGMPDVEDYEWDKPQYDDEALERWVRTIGDKSLLFPPGTGHEYSNIGSEVLGDMLAKVSGMSFEECIAKQVFEPLKMTKATLLIRETDSKDRVSPHTLDGRLPVVLEHWPYNRRHAPSSTLIASVHDLGRWADANLNGGALDGVQILKEESYDQLWQPTVTIAPNRGLSWSLGTHKGHRTVRHMGYDKGFSTALILLPDLDLGIAMATNTDRAPFSKLVRITLDSATAALGK